MAAIRKHWREASTLILVIARHSGSNVKPKFVSSSSPAGALAQVNMEVLLLKRSAKSKFMPNLYVFPGGVASDVDFSADWIPVFDLLGKDNRQNLFDFVQRGGQGAPLFSRQRVDNFSHIPSEIAFRICAIRESFEESGVLIARRVEKGKGFRPSPWNKDMWASYIPDETVIKEWRQKVNEDPQEFLHMCQKLEVVPDVWSLHEWSNWLTPCGLKQRFDTAFFICCLQDKPNVAEDEWETVHSQWGSPYDILQEYYQGGVALAPPQIYELGRLMNFSTVPDLLKFACQRGQHRVERWLPVKVASSDSLMSVFPGDSLYPKDIDPEGPDVTFTHTERLAELDNSHPNKHRALVNPEMRHADGRMCYRVVCNIALPGEHVAPHIPDSEFKFVPRL